MWWLANEILNLIERSQHKQLLNWLHYAVSKTLRNIHLISSVASENIPMAT